MSNCGPGATFSIWDSASTVYRQRSWPGGQSHRLRTAVTVLLPCSLGHPLVPLASHLSLAPCSPAPPPQLLPSVNRMPLPVEPDEINRNPQRQPSEVSNEHPEEQRHGSVIALQATESQ